MFSCENCERFKNTYFEEHLRTAPSVNKRLVFFIKYQLTEAVVRRCSVKKVFLEILQNSQENTCARVSFLIKLQANTFYYYRTPRVAASQLRWLWNAWILRNHLQISILISVKDVRSHSQARDNFWQLRPALEKWWKLLLFDLESFIRSLSWKKNGFIRKIGLIDVKNWEINNCNTHIAHYLKT